MINFAQKKYKNHKQRNIQFNIADNLSLPLEDDFSDISIEGWSFCNILFNKDNWRN